LVDCLIEAAGTPGFVKPCNALTGYNTFAKMPELERASVVALL
jgi:hypothetical protein